VKFGHVYERLVQYRSHSTQLTKNAYYPVPYQRIFKYLREIYPQVFKNHEIPDMVLHDIYSLLNNPDEYCKVYNPRKVAYFMLGLLNFYKEQHKQGNLEAAFIVDQFKRAHRRAVCILIYSSVVNCPINHFNYDKDFKI